MQFASRPERSQAATIETQGLAAATVQYSSLSSTPPGTGGTGRSALHNASESEKSRKLASAASLQGMAQGSVRSPISTVPTERAQPGPRKHRKVVAVDMGRRGSRCHVLPRLSNESSGRRSTSRHSGKNVRLPCRVGIFAGHRLASRE